MTDIEQDLLIAQAEVRELKKKLGYAALRESILAGELAALRTDISDVCRELESLCRSGKPEPEEITRWVLTLGKLIGQGK